MVNFKLPIGLQFFMHFTFVQLKTAGKMGGFEIFPRQTA